MQYFVSRVGFSFHNFQAEFAANVAAVHSSSGHLGLIALSGIYIGVILANIHVRIILMMPFAVNPQVLEEREPLSALSAGVVLLDVLLLMPLEGACVEEGASALVALVRGPRRRDAVDLVVVVAVLAVAGVGRVCGLQRGAEISPGRRVRVAGAHSPHQRPPGRG